MARLPLPPYFSSFSASSGSTASAGPLVGGQAAGGPIGTNREAHTSRATGSKGVLSSSSAVNATIALEEEVPSLSRGLALSGELASTGGSASFHFVGGSALEMNSQSGQLAPVERSIGESASSSTQGVRVAPRARPQLRLVEDPVQFREEFEVNLAEPVHSLHELDVEPYRLQPRLARALIERFSNRGDVVLDPCGRFGTVALESLLLGRDGRCAERHPVLASIAGAKITPGDIAEVALMCQSLAMRRPVALDAYRSYFSHHFDVETYRELVTLRALLADSHARIENVVRAIALALLHGPSAGYFSVAAPVTVALSQEEQRVFNLKRGQRPDYRAVLPRLLKRAATLTRDGMPSFASRARRKTVGTLLCDPRKLDPVEESSIDLIVTEPPLPDPAFPMPGDASWLRNWFVGSDTRSLMDLEGWNDWINQCLVEWARVLKPGKRLLLVLGAFFPGGEQPEGLVESQVVQALSRFFAVEGLLVERKRTNVVRGAARDDGLTAARILVLKRR